MYELRNIWLALTLIGVLAVVAGQRVAPGVPPQHYQQGQPQQHVNQQQYQQQQPHGHTQQQYQQYQQPHGHAPGVPPQQQQQFQQQPQYQQQQQHQQAPPQQQQQQYQQPQQHQQQQHQAQQGHGHGHGHGQPGQILNQQNLEHEKDHLGEHLNVPNLDTSKMSEQELQFHYFKMHDSDNNNKLDGCELIKSLIHWHAQGKNEDHGKGVEEKIFSDEELQSLIDPILKTDDASQDGFIDYPEFVRAQQKAATQKEER
uniref:CSON012808 protein n=1 Tax=Culicoides sonorensis TaxID=179676 RepID=A0A336M6D7_CULSO